MATFAGNPVAATLDGTEIIPLTQGGIDKRSTAAAIAALFVETKGADIASAATTNIGAATGIFVHVTGTTSITALGTAAAGIRRVVRFAGALTLTHNATSLILPTAANITTAVNDVATFVSEASGNWRCIGYLRADGTALASGGSGSSPSINAQTGTSYTAALADEIVTMDNAAANTLTVPPNSSVAFPIGRALEVWQAGAGQTTIAAGAGVTILKAAAITLKLKQQNSGCSLRKVATNTWRLVGDMELT